MRIAIDLPLAYRLLNHGPVTLVSSAHGGVKNVMAAAWAMPLDFDPPKVAVVIDANTFTRHLVEASDQQRHDLFLAEVVAAQADDRVFREGRWQFDGDDLRTLHYFGGGAFAVTGATVEVSADTS